MCFCVFSEVRDPNGAPKGGLEALLGPSWDPLGDFGHTFAASRLQVCLQSAKSDETERSRVVKAKGLRQDWAQRRGGRLRLRAMQRIFVNHPARPATSAEVRRIYRLPPLPPTSLDSNI